jgi:hypothetical protein
MVRMLASTRNEPFSSRKEDMSTSLVWPSPQSSLVAEPPFVSPQDYDVARPDTVPPDPVLHLNTNECGAKNCRVSIPQWNANPPFPWGHNLLPTPTSRGCPQGEQLEVTPPPAGVDPDGRVYQAGIRIKETCPVGLHRYLYLCAVSTPGTLVPCTITVQLKSPGPKHEAFTQLTTNTTSPMYCSPI